MKQPAQPSRRRFLKTAGAAGLGACIGLPAYAQARQIVVADPGGPYTAAYRKAFYDPFEQATGIKVVNVAREAQPVAQLTALVETRNYIWDVTTLTLSADIPYLESKGLLEPIGFTAADVPGLIPQAVTANWMGVDIYAAALAYRSDKFAAQGPASWADFWDVAKFPGRRSRAAARSKRWNRRCWRTACRWRSCIRWTWSGPSAAWTASRSTSISGGRPARRRCRPSRTATST